MKVKFLKLFCFLLVGFCLFFGTNGKAEASGITIESTQQYSKDVKPYRTGETLFFENTVSANCENPYTVLFWSGYSDGRTYGRPKYNGVEMYPLKDYAQYMGGQYSRTGVFSYVPTPGTKLIELPNQHTVAEAGYPGIFVVNFCNVDNINSFIVNGAASATGWGSATFGTGDFLITNADTLYVSFLSFRDSTGENIIPNGGTKLNPLPIHYDNGSVGGKLTVASNQFSLGYHNITWPTASTYGIELSYLSLIYKESVPATYCGDTICQTANENCDTCPVDCGECASNPVNDISNLFFFYNPYTLYNQTTGKIRYIYDQNYITSHDYIEIRKISDDWATSTFMATSTIIDETGFFADKNDGNSFFPLSAEASSTSGYIHYEVIGHLAAYWSPTLGDVAATTTIPYVVTVNWQTLEQPTVADIIAASSSNPFYDKNSIEQAVCTPEQWATPDPQMWLTGTPMPALNFTVMSCVLKFSLLDMGNKFVTVVTNGFYKAENILKNVFPFNIFTNLNNAWKNSETTGVLSELSFLTPTNGNLTAQIPTTGTSTATIVLWGKDIFTSSSTLGTTNANKANQMFLAIKTIIKWALWGLFGLWAIKNGKDFVKNLTSSE